MGQLSFGLLVRHLLVSIAGERRSQLTILAYFARKRRLWLVIFALNKRLSISLLRFYIVLTQSVMPRHNRRSGVFPIVMLVAFVIAIMLLDLEGLYETMLRFLLPVQIADGTVPGHPLVIALKTHATYIFTWVVLLLPRLLQSLQRNLLRNLSVLALLLPTMTWWDLLEIGSAIGRSIVSGLKAMIGYVLDSVFSSLSWYPWLLGCRFFQLEFWHLPLVQSAVGGIVQLLLVAALVLAVGIWRKGYGRSRTSGPRRYH